MLCLQWRVWGASQSVLMTVSPTRLLSKDSPSGVLKAVVRECTVKAEERQFLEVWPKLFFSFTQSLHHLPPSPS